MFKVCMILAIFATISSSDSSKDTRLIKEYYTASKEKIQLVQETVKERKKLRKHEAECSKRRCCLMRNDIDEELNIPSNLDCKLLSDIECCQNDDFCEWKCNPSGSNEGKRGKFKRRFRGISYQKGKYKGSNPRKDKKTAETYNDFLSESKVISIDDCGTMYNEQLPIEIIETNWKNKKMNAYTKEYNKDQNHSITGSKRTLLDILANDNRSQVISTAFPWSTVLYLNFEKGDGSIGRCTATMISKRWAMTAAHCIYGDGDFYSNFVLYKNVFDCGDKVNGLYSDLQVIFDAYSNGETWEHDIGLIRLSTTDSGLGYLGFGYQTVWSSIHYFNLVSYPQDKPDCSKWYQYCSYDDFYSYTMVTSECDTWSGTSGASVYQYMELEEERTIYAIHAKGACYLPDGTYQTENVCNTAITITAGKFTTICEYIEEDEPGRCGLEMVTGY